MHNFIDGYSIFSDFLNFSSKFQANILLDLEICKKII